MTDQITIVGAGLAGLLAANMLNRHDPQIIEAQKSVPNNHSAVLRFRSNIVGEALGLTFRRVQVVKASAPWVNPVADALSYSFKNLGQRLSDRSIRSQAEMVERYIAPSNLIAIMMGGPDADQYRFGQFHKFDVEGPTISTVPMPVLMNVLDYPRRHEYDFKYRSALNIRARLRDTDAYASLAVPDPSKPYSRISVTGNELIIECPGLELDESVPGAATQLAYSAATHELGFSPETIDKDVMGVTVSRSTYAKITPVDDDFRHDFMHWATVNRNVYSLGRFATWRPGLLLDDLVPDIRKIERWTRSSSGYEHRKDHS